MNVIARFPELRRIFDRHFVDAMIILSRDPLASKETNALIKQQLKVYIKEKNHTSIDIHLWPSLLKLWFSLARNAAPKEESAADIQFFD